MVVLTKEMLTWIAFGGVTTIVTVGLLGAILITNATSSNIIISEVTLKKAQNHDAFLTVAIKNTGSNHVKDIHVTIKDIILRTGGTHSPNDVFNVPYSVQNTPRDVPTNNPIDIESGSTKYVTGVIKGSGNLQVGDSFVIEIKGNVNGNDIINTGIVTVSRD